MQSLGDVQAPALHIFNNLLCFQLWVHVGLHELSPRIVEFDSDRLKASLHSKENPAFNSKQRISTSRSFLPRITKSRPEIDFFRPLKITVPQVGRQACLFGSWSLFRGHFINFLAGHSHGKCYPKLLATTKSAPEVVVSFTFEAIQVCTEV